MRAFLLMSLLVALAACGESVAPPTPTPEPSRESDVLNIAEAWAAQSDAEIAKEVASLVAKAPAVQEVLDSTPNVLRQAALNLLAEAAATQLDGAEISISKPEGAGDIYRVTVTVDASITSDLPGVGELTTYVQVPFLLDIDLGETAVTDFKVDSVNATVRSE